MSRAALIMTLITLGIPFAATAQSQPMPWQQAPNVSQAPAANVPQAYYPRNNAMPSPAPVASREQDDRKLDMLATKFYAIKATDPHAIFKLKRLQGEVHGFRTNLAYKGYDAADILRDAKKLEIRISSQRKKLEAQAGSVASAPAPHPIYAPAPVSAPAPMTAPALAPAPAPAAGLDSAAPLPPAPSTR